jgi:hypothetical protein
MADFYENAKDFFDILLYRLSLVIHFIITTLPGTICDTKEKKIEYHPVQKLSSMWTGAIHPCKRCIVIKSSVLMWMCVMLMSNRSGLNAFASSANNFVGNSGKYFLAC